MMRKLISVFLVLGMLLFMTSCGAGIGESEPVEPIPDVPQVLHEAPAVETSGIENELPAVEPTPIATAEPVVQTPVPTTAPSPTPVPAPTAVPTPAPTATPEPVSSHTHAWVPVTKTVHHEAVVEQEKVIDQPATEGHFEGGTYPVVICRCGAEFTTAADYYAHSEASGEGHGGFTDSIRSNQVWVEGTPEVSHYETKVVQEAWDEEVITGYRCSCGATK